MKVTDLVSVYRLVTEVPFESCQDAEIGDIAVGVCSPNQIPENWNLVMCRGSTIHLQDFDKDKPFPGIIIFTPETSESAAKYERTTLKGNQIWYPKVNCRTYKEKQIVSIKNNELGYRMPGHRAWGPIEMFFEWIIITGASLSKHRE